MEDCTRTIYVVEGRRWWCFTAREWTAVFSSAIASVRSGEGYELPDKNRVSGPPMCAQRIDGEDAWYSDRSDTEIFFLHGWDSVTWEEEFAIMRESGYLE
jgi:hypothetical protein